MATLQETGSFSEVIERLDQSLIGLDKNFAPSFRKHPEKFSRPAAFQTLVDFKIVRMSFWKQMPSQNGHFGSYAGNI